MLLKCVPNLYHCGQSAVRDGARWLSVSSDDEGWGIAASLPEIVTAKKCFSDGLFNLAVPPLRRALEILQHARDEEGTKAASKATQMLITCYHRQGRFGCIEKVCRQQDPRRDPSDPTVLPSALFPNRRHLLLNSLLRQHRWQPALTLADQLLKDHGVSSLPSSVNSQTSNIFVTNPIFLPQTLDNPAELLVTKGLILYRLGQSESASSAFSHALDVKIGDLPRLEALVFLGRFDAAQDLIAKSGGLTQRARGRIDRALAIKAWRDDNLVPESEKLFDQALSHLEDPEQVAWTLYELARMYHNRSRHIFAEGLYTRVTEIFVDLHLYFDAHFVQQDYSRLLSTLGQHTKGDGLLQTSAQRVNAVDLCH